MTEIPMHLDDVCKLSMPPCHSGVARWPYILNEVFRRAPYSCHLCQGSQSQVNTDMLAGHTGAIIANFSWGKMIYEWTASLLSPYSILGLFSTCVNVLANEKGNITS